MPFLVDKSSVINLNCDREFVRDLYRNGDVSGNFLPFIILNLSNTLRGQKMDIYAFGMLMCEFGTISAAQIGKAAEEGSEGTEICCGKSSEGPCKFIIFPISFC